MPTTNGETAPASSRSTIASSRSARPSRDAAGPDEHVTLRRATPIAKRSRSPKRSPIAAASRGDGGGSLEVARRLVPEDERDQQVAVLGRFLRPRLEQPLRATEPAARRADPRLGMRGSSRSRSPTRDRPQRLASLEVQVMCALEDLDRLVVSGEHQQRRRQELEIVALERSSLVRAENASYASSHAPVAYAARASSSWCGEVCWPGPVTARSFRILPASGRQRVNERRSRSAARARPGSAGSAAAWRARGVRSR